jgi:MFS family permease
VDRHRVRARLARRAVAAHHGQPAGPTRNRALALWQAATAGGATTGIIAGGLLTQYLGWRAVFLVNPPLIAAAAFIYSERTVASPMIPPTFLSEPARRAAVAAMLLTGARLAPLAIVLVATQVLGPRSPGPAGAATSTPAGTSSRPDAP